MKNAKNATYLLILKHCAFVFGVDFFIKSILRLWFWILEVYIVWQQVKRNCRCHTKRRVYLWLWIMTVAGKIAWWCKGENGIDWSPTHYWGMLWSATNRASANAILQLNSPLCFGIIVHSWLLKWLTTRHLTIVQNKTRVMPPAKCRGGCHFPDHAQCWKIIPKLAFNMWTKVHPKWSIWASFWNPRICRQIVLHRQIIFDRTTNGCKYPQMRRFWANVGSTLVLVYWYLIFVLDSDPFPQRIFELPRRPSCDYSVLHL